MKLPDVFGRNLIHKFPRGDWVLTEMNLKKQQRTPRLERRNAAKNIEYAPTEDGSSSGFHSTSEDFRIRSLDCPLPPSINTMSSFRIDGEYEGEVDIICRNLGLNGPEDFAIPAAAWEARKSRSSSDVLPKSRLFYYEDDVSEGYLTRNPSAEISVDALDGVSVEERSTNFEDEEEKPPTRALVQESASRTLRVGGYDPPSSNQLTMRIDKDEGDGGGGGGGIRGPRPPPVLKPSPATRPQRIPDNQRSIFDLLKSLNPQSDDEGDKGSAKRSDSNHWEGDKWEAEAVQNIGVPEENDDDNDVQTSELIAGPDLTGSSSFTTSNDDDSPVYISSRNSSRYRHNITEWSPVEELGRGSFGTVYKTISDDGFFFAVKEVSLLDQGNNAKQCIQQLEQEIALLSNFEHENIVQYLGTKKEETKLFIFLELVTQGSLASLYQKCVLRDSQVSVYTRQILNGLKYLHEQKVVHRDIKCANILVDANGFVKLADFGLAKETSKLNVLKSCKGSVFWMAPEVVKPNKTYGPAADIWSLGCTVLEMLTGKLPYPDLEWTSALYKIGRGKKPQIPDSLSKDARDFIGQCVQVEPDDRPTASELLDHPFVKKNVSSLSGSEHSSHGRSEHSSHGRSEHSSHGKRT